MSSRLRRFLLLTVLTTVPAVCFLMPLPPASAGYCLSKVCHADLVNRTFLHGPVGLEKQAQGGCVLCHTPAGDPCTPRKAGTFKYEMSWDALCMNCHGGTISPDHKLPARPCVICHDPHGSNESKRLFRKGILSAPSPFQGYRRDHNAPPIDDHD